MIISCPSCSARFTVDDSALGPEGRKVKCSKCGHIWHQQPEPVALEPDPEPPPAVAAALRAAEEDPAPVRRRPRAAAPVREKRRSGAAAMWILLIVILAGILGGGYVYRDRIMSELPATEPIFAAIGLGPESPYAGLDLIGVTSKQEDGPDGAKILKITGKVVNSSDKPKDVPGLSGRLYDEENRELYRWSFKAPQPGRLLPSEEVAFATEVRNPNKKAAGLTITFDEAKKPAK